ncbi:hypothetical protein SRHO_G00328270 [Serrasalmus rhombeus]
MASQRAYTQRRSVPTGKAGNCLGPPGQQGPPEGRQTLLNSEPQQQDPCCATAYTAKEVLAILTNVDSCESDGGEELSRTYEITSDSSDEDTSCASDEVIQSPPRKRQTTSAPVTDYNRMKCAVDIMDQKVRAYTVRAGTRRWPVAVFYNLLDLAAMNAHVLYTACTGSTESRRVFLCALAEELRHRYRQEKELRKTPRPLPAPGKKTQCQVLPAMANPRNLERLRELEVLTGSVNVPRTQSSPLRSPVHTKLLSEPVKLLKLAAKANGFSPGYEHCSIP